MMFPLVSCGRFSENPKVTSASLETESDSTVYASHIPQSLILGANRTETYLPILKGKKIGVVCNPSSLILKEQLPNGEKEYTHLVDSLLSLNQKVVRVFSPEHGFRGTADAGEQVEDGKDSKTGLPIVSLYGKNKKPSAAQLQDIDILIFDIQDVGVRFYTYIATMHYVMEAAAENNIPILVFDRPNPNGHYVDGPVMEVEHTSFLGMHAGVPLVHGMTIGEYAKMINGEGWLKNQVQADLTVIPMENYTHDLKYSLPVRPSPNLPNDQSINLYPSLGLLEGTNLNAGRGTEMQFQVMGSPLLPKDKYFYCYTPQPNFGSKSPKHKDEECCGFDLRDIPRLAEVNLSWIVQAYADHTHKEKFFNTTNFTAHAGTEKLQQQIEAGLNMDEIRKSWQQDLKAFKEVRAHYLLYK
ncbi:MAG: DUF1343 domain-containing protein [Leeuwenhoekiella sp.]